MDAPVVLTFGGHDPSSGAGIAADAATLWALGCYPVCVLTAVTVQNTLGVTRFSILDPALVAAQAQALIRDLPVQAVKTGMLGSAGVVEAVAAALEEIREVPVVVDPVLASDAGDSLSETGLTDALRRRLLARTRVVTPNLLEAQALSGADQPAVMAERMLACGCDGVLITGTHAGSGPEIVHRWFRRGQAPRVSRWPRLEGRFHGSGCTLAAAISGHLAKGLDSDAAVARGLQFSWDAVAHGTRPGRGQRVPDRFFATAHSGRTGP